MCEESNISIWPMTIENIPDIARIESLAYGDELNEPIEVLASKFRLASEFCFVAQHRQQTVGYIIAHPWPRDSSPGIGKAMTTIPACADAIHIHDLSIDPIFQGLGIGKALYRKLAHSCVINCFDTLTLVAVQNAMRFWESFGFRVLHRVEGYDEHAVFMTLTLQTNP